MWSGVSDSRANSSELLWIISWKKNQLLSSIVGARLLTLKPVFIFVKLVAIKNLLVRIIRHFNRNKWLQIVKAL